MHLTRRDALRLGATAALSLIFLPVSTLVRADDSGAQAAMTADQALQMLLDGNQRFVSGTPLYPNQSLDQRATVAKGQSPFAAVLSCIDSRVPPELVFDRGLGDLFTARVGAAIVDDELMGSIEFGIEEFHIPLVVVLGHQRCGAVTATVDAVTKGGEAAGHIGSVVDAITPAVMQVLNQPGDLVDNSVRAVVRQSTASLRTTSPIIAEAIHASSTQVVGCYYSLDTGIVQVIDRG